ncbi:MerR family DNA-binding transcriptional regulator [Rhodovulum sp. 12E13]|uniref:MerR family transcriptional regulator n=1 Tax=Rhodovulum sp. 12E13 TaxID=2203891 RepID=UPI000E1916E8|nr:MerR family DNA-binding transcriptional regulator [Rhodovulum sp. 12E13]RDC72407.1 MerR family DNA-binding transcriptional regulator [Rhodovulum sp. 12E13]
MTETRLSFKEMCARFEVTPRTLRYYEYLELLSPDRDGRARFYGPREVARMTLILRGRRFGFSLEEIRQWLDLYEKQGTTAQQRAFVAQADDQLAELERRRTEIEEAILDLRRLRDDAASRLN